MNKAILIALCLLLILSSGCVSKEGLGDGNSQNDQANDGYVEQPVTTNGLVLKIPCEMIESRNVSGGVVDYIRIFTDDKTYDVVVVNITSMSEQPKVLEGNDTMYLYTQVLFGAEPFGQGVATVTAFGSIKEYSESGSYVLSFDRARAAHLGYTAIGLLRPDVKVGERFPESDALMIGFW